MREVLRGSPWACWPGWCSTSGTEYVAAVGSEASALFACEITREVHTLLVALSFSYLNSVSSLSANSYRLVSIITIPSSPFTLRQSATSPSDDSHHSLAAVKSPCTKQNRRIRLVSRLACANAAQLALGRTHDRLPPAVTQLHRALREVAPRVPIHSDPDNAVRHLPLAARLRPRQLAEAEVFGPSSVEPPEGRSAGLESQGNTEPTPGVVLEVSSSALAYVPMAYTKPPQSVSPGVGSSASGPVRGGTYGGSGGHPADRYDAFCRCQLAAGASRVVS